ncbi:MAG: invasion associated locus B family protein [Chromatiaceae bacterium]|nr:invasion associated locus B family protein [Gammaproteobacteria bacterium]MCP5298290.1 invasion associated locus B family protein [Chromatiaceae bacterium]MCP5423170.1 invasion associated locus B family protein [Chromatiaceae bacterium]
MRRYFVASLVLFSGVMLSQAAAAEENKGKSFDDWGYQCEKSPDGKEEFCFVFQNVTKKDTKQLVLGARVAYRPEQKEPLVVVTVPLGTLLPPGAALVMEGVDPLKMPFFLCAQEGCTTVATPIPDAMIDAMKKGDAASIRIAAPNKQVIGLPLSLKGFTKALAILKK